MRATISGANSDTRLPRKSRSSRAKLTLPTDVMVSTDFSENGQRKQVLVTDIPDGWQIGFAVPLMFTALLAFLALVVLYPVGLLFYSGFVVEGASGNVLTGNSSTYNNERGFDLEEDTTLNGSESIGNDREGIVNLVGDTRA